MSKALNFINPDELSMQCILIALNRFLQVVKVLPLSQSIILSLYFPFVVLEKQQKALILTSTQDSICAKSIKDHLIDFFIQLDHFFLFHVSVSS